VPLSRPYHGIYRHGPPAVIEPFLLARRDPEGLNALAGYAMLKKDLRVIFEYVEPDSGNLGTFSHRIFAFYGSLAPVAPLDRNVDS